MLEKKLQNITRPTLDALTKEKHLEKLINRQQHVRKKQTWRYVTTLIAFVVLSLFFIQSLQFTAPNEQQQAQELKVGPIQKASYLYSTNAIRSYNFPSIFITGEEITTDVSYLQSIEQLLNGLEKIPFEGSLSAGQGAAHYMLEQKNGDNIYLKKVYFENSTILIDMKTNQAIHLSEETASELEKIWMNVYLEDNDFPLWKIIVLTVLVCFVVFVWKRERVAFKKRKTASMVVNIVLFVLLFSSYNLFFKWYGVANLAIFSLFMAFYMTVDYIVDRKFNQSKLSWNQYLIGLVLTLGIVFVLFV
ncbi:hypothetical protein LZ480_05275 [Solibacillus sp. MA9]|uniref:Uncharacterized protein n=1 Tax=Solibacillus palustris TaxID=2908203 RepID=A0ABS9UAE4_9BACL|nr:hypothetical protein [Solibacillus sp. MA9]MCH7321297.1 hypothetical protein [Solibacillus sp. MA9]